MEAKPDFHFIHELEYTLYPRSTIKWHLGFRSTSYLLQKDAGNLVKRGAALFGHNEPQ